MNLPNKKNDTTNPALAPITCPRCGSKELAFVTEYHKCVLVKFIANIILASIVLILVFNLSTLISQGVGQYITPVIILTALYICCQIYILAVESRTHVKAICQNCGNLWLLD